MFLQGFSCFLPLTSFRTKQANVTEDSPISFPLLRLTCHRRHCHILLFSFLGWEERGMNYNPIFVCLNSTEFLIFCPETFLLSSVSPPPLFPLFVHLSPSPFFREQKEKRREGRGPSLPLFPLLLFGVISFPFSPRLLPPSVPQISRRKRRGEGKLPASQVSPGGRGKKRDRRGESKGKSLTLMKHRQIKM